VRDGCGAWKTHYEEFLNAGPSLQRRISEIARKKGFEVSEVSRFQKQLRNLETLNLET
jgi:hypothetical protein